MFADAIERIGEFTRPIKFISRNYKDTTVVPGLATLFFINEQGYALTCKHVVEQLIEADNLNRKYMEYKNELLGVLNESQRKSIVKQLEQKYSLRQDQIVQMKIQLPNCVDLFDAIDFTVHKEYDIAVIHFKGFNNTAYNGHAVFAENNNGIRPGDMLCRLGFPFPEFTDFEYNSHTDDIEWTNVGTSNTPRFPMEGMFTRNISDQKGNIFAIELSTPGLRGQSGGPLFSSSGLIYGMQSMTNHLHLGFDMVREKIIVNGKEQTVNNQPFLHVGQCVHLGIIKDFLYENNIKYYVGDSDGNVKVVNG